MSFLKKIKKIYHFILAWLGNLIYGFPSRKIFVIGVTGTKGKSTTLALINTILEEAGYKTALLSSVRIKIDFQNQINTGNSMPGRFVIKKFLKKAVKAGCAYALIEVTSEGVSQHRHRFIDWDAAIFINLAPEHIEAHGSFEKYREAKLSFFRYVVKSPKPKIYFFINQADPSASFFEKVAKERQDAFIGLFSGEDFRKSNIYHHLKNEWLKNDFNAENAAAAVAFARSQNISETIIVKALEKFPGLPGRLEFIQKEPFKVVIDYAHTPDSLEKVYKYLKSQMPEDKGQRLICVLGSAGKGKEKLMGAPGVRDKWKRPVMGKIAAQYCQEIILTNEDPYDEDPLAILEEIEKGSGPVIKILDRREAIKKAISLAKEGDTVVITGKGSEPWIHGAKGKKIPWDERKIIEEILKFNN